jgi:hypothetical protein
MRIGMRAGTNNELVIVNTDPLGKRCVCRCSACGRTFVVGADTFAAGGVACSCQPLSADHRDALRAEAQDSEWRRQQQDWRPQR